MVRSSDSTFQLASVTLEQFQRYLDGDPANRFAKTFVAKANMQRLWPCLGAWQEEVLLGAIAWTITKREPRVANLQLLHVFATNRNQGVGKLLCQEMVSQVQSKATYFRVSSEPSARAFYERLGVCFLGVQKSGCLLAMGVLETSLELCRYSLEDEVIRKAVYKKGKGGCVTVFDNKNTPQG